MTDNLFRFDRPSVDGPVDVYSGRAFVAVIHHPERGAGAMLTLLVPMRLSHVIKLGVELRGWEPVPFWISWWTTEGLGGYELRWPWWISGERGDGARSVVAAIRAASADDAMEAILASYDVRPDDLEWRFVSVQEPDWSPFTDRFPHRAWMKW